MVGAAIVFFVLAIIAFLFGAYGIAGMSMGIGKLFLVVFLLLAAISFIGSIISGKKPKMFP